MEKAGQAQTGIGTDRDAISGGCASFTISATKLMQRDLKIKLLAASEFRSALDMCGGWSQHLQYPSFFCSADWLNAVLDVADKSSLLALAALRNDTICALLPLQRERNNLGGTDLTYLGSEFHPDPIGILCDDAMRAEAATAYKRHLGNMPAWDRLILSGLVESEISAWGASANVMTVAPFLPLPRNVQELLSDRSGKARKKIRWEVRRIEHSGALFQVAKTGADKHEYLDRLLELKAERARRKNTSSTFSGDRVSRLHHLLIESSQCPWLFALKDDSGFLAVLYGFEYFDRFFFYQIAHDPQFDRLSPGRVLLYLVFKWCCDQGLSEFNFLQGDEAYKFRWTSHRRDLHTLELCSGSIRGRALNAADRVRKLASATVKRDNKKGV